MSTSETITRTDLTNILNEVLPTTDCVTDVEVNGTSVVTDRVAEVELKTVNGQSLLGSGAISLPQIRKGYKSLGEVAANSYRDVAVTYSPAMSGTPNVVISMVSTSTSPTMGGIAVSAINSSASGFTCRVFNNTSSARSPAIEYIAIYGSL